MRGAPPTRRGLLAGAVAATALAATAAAVWAASRPAAAADPVLAAARRRGYLIAGVPLWLPPFGAPGRAGGWVGLDVAVARGAAAAALGSPERLHLLPLTPAQRLWALGGGGADLVAAAYAAPGTAPPVLPAALAAVGPYFGEPLALLLRRGQGLAPADLDGRLVGVLPGSAGGAALRAAVGARAAPVLEELPSAALGARDLALGRLRAVVGGQAACRALAAYDPQLQAVAQPALGQESYWVLVPAAAPAIAAAARAALSGLPRGRALAQALAAWSAPVANPPLPHPERILTPPPQPA